MASQYPQTPGGKAPDTSKAPNTSKAPDTFTQPDGDDAPVTPRRVRPNGQGSARRAPEGKKAPRTVFSDWASI